MSDGKSHQFRPPLYPAETTSKPADRVEGRERPARPTSEQKGWDAYRKWLSSVSGKASSERVPLDTSIYSWKGYQNWADRVRQSWKADEN